MKKCIFLLLAVFTLTFTACEKENYAPFNDEDDDWFVDSEDQGDEDDQEEIPLTDYTISGDEITIIKDYDVPARLQNLRDDKARHQEIWDHYIRMIPAEARTRIVEFELFVSDELGGYVVNIEDDLSQWKMGLNIEVFGDLSVIDFSEEAAQLVIHEVAHVLTLDNTQINSRIDENGCMEFFVGEGCSRTDSYIDRLFELGWADIYASHDEDNPDPTYNRYPDRFVTEYAATNPAEDIAEVFAFFVSEPARRTGNSIADQKIQLMYEFPELVALRDRIRATGEVNGLTAGISIGALRASNKMLHAAHRH